ncbi:MAG: DNA polymerase III subunit epsilon [Proteobacteria bacterium]|nr:DNA polymerase III subunit epsilon [Pseudomonadota bacterium]
MSRDETGSADALRAAVALLDAHPDYRVLHRLPVVADFGVASAGATAIAIVLDTETTGVSRDSDQMIEIALLRFEYAVATGDVLRITDVYSGLEDPGRPIPPESTAIHGITDAMVAGKTLDEARIAGIVRDATLVVAHNAAFDRPFVEARLPLFAGLPWGCSLEQVPWAEEGFRGSKLEYLGWASGFFYDAHRSETDCRALLEVLRRPLPKSGTIAFKKLVEAAAEPALRLWATGSPFETKDLLRERGYRWDADRRCWHRVVPRAEAKEESEWLKAAVYGGRSAQIEVEVLDARVRFSGRPGPRKTRVI